MAQGFLTFTLLPRMKLWAARGVTAALFGRTGKQYVPEFVADALVQAEIAATIRSLRQGDHERHFPIRTKSARSKIGAPTKRRRIRVPMNHRGARRVE